MKTTAVRLHDAYKLSMDTFELPEITEDEALFELGKTDPLCAELARIVAANGGLWCAEAEAYLLANAKRV